MPPLKAAISSGASTLLKKAAVISAHANPQNSLQAGSQ
jgi:hypothetical protein